MGSWNATVNYTDAAGAPEAIIAAARPAQAGAGVLDEAQRDAAAEAIGTLLASGAYGPGPFGISATGHGTDTEPGEQPGLFTVHILLAREDAKPGAVVDPSVPVGDAEAVEAV